MKQTLFLLGVLIMTLSACGPNGEFKSIDPHKIRGNAIDLIGNRWMLISAGTPDSFNTMTASWGSLGQLWGKPAAFIFVRKTRYTKEFLDRGNMFTLSFFPEEQRPALQLLGTKSGRDTDKIKESGLTPWFTPVGNPAFKEASLVIECRKTFRTEISPENFIDTSILDQWYADKNYHDMYVGEITAAWTK